MLKNYIKLAVLLIVLLTAISHAVHAQHTPEAFLGNLPVIPDNGCISDKSVKEKFMADVQAIIDQIDAELDKRNENDEAYHKAHQNDITNSVAEKTGLSKKKLQKIMQDSENGKEMSDEESEALANEVMQRKANMSLADLKKLQGMDDASQKAWANDYASKMKADVLKNPDKYKKENEKNMKSFNAASENKNLLDKIKAGETRIQKMFDEIEKQDAAVEIKNDIKATNDRINQLLTSDSYTDDEIVNLYKTLTKLEEKYCEYCSPRYLIALEQYLTYTKTSLPNYYRLEELSNQHTKMQMDVKSFTEPGTVALGAVKSYAKMLMGSFGYYREPHIWATGGD